MVTMYATCFDKSENEDFSFKIYKIIDSYNKHSHHFIINIQYLHHNHIYMIKDILIIGNTKIYM